MSLHYKNNVKMYKLTAVFYVVHAIETVVRCFCRMSSSVRIFYFLQSYLLPFSQVFYQNFVIETRHI